MKHQHHTEQRSRPGAFTLVELLVAGTLALVVMATLASLFGLFGRAVADSQEMVQLAGRMRSAAWRLRQDLQGATMEAKPFVRPEAAGGYLEIVEGPTVGSSPGSLDADDILMLTTASPSRPFSGIIALTTPTTTTVQTVGLQSPVAEVAWFCKSGRQTDEGIQLFNLYRRQLLVMAAPALGMMADSNSTPLYMGTEPPLAWDMFFDSNDLSVRREGSTLIANSLSDLTRRQSRFMHNVFGLTVGGVAPIQTGVQVTNTWPQITTTSTLSGASDILIGDREGEDLVLSDILAFDIRVYDPRLGDYRDLASTNVLVATAPVLTGTGVPVISGTAILRSNTGTSSLMRLAQTGTGAYKFYDTWSLHAEYNNVADNMTWAQWMDRSTNWIDNPINGVVDDIVELEQPPPYAVPLRGVEIGLRCYEPTTQEVRQITVRHSFLAR